MAENCRSRITPDQSPSSIRSNRSQRITSNSHLQRPLSAASTGQGLLHRATSRFSLNENFAASRREYIFNEEDDNYSFDTASLSRTGEAQEAIDEDNAITFDDSQDFYRLLGLSRDQQPTTSEIIAAYKWQRTSLEINDHGQQTYELQEVFRKHRMSLEYAYETLKHPHRRFIYNLLGENGLRMHYAPLGIMGKGGYAEQASIDVESMDVEDFAQWFRYALKIKHLGLQSVCGSHGCWIIGNYSGGLALHQTFKIPLGNLKALFSWRERRM